MEEQPRFVRREDFEELGCTAESGRDCDYLREALEAVLRTTPPKEHYSVDDLQGVFTGYTGLALLFLQLSRTYPNLAINGMPLIAWANAYLQGERGRLTLGDRSCGLSSECLSFAALKACSSQSEADVQVFLQLVDKAVKRDFPSELANGYAGTLYLARLVQYWVPAAARKIFGAIDALSRKTLNSLEGGEWLWHGKRYFGACHGEIGIITQLILSQPALSGQLESRLESLLRRQDANGNWPSSAGRTTNDLVQWCHGAPGFAISLIAVQPHFPRLQPHLDKAIDKAQRLIWDRGLLTKEPSLCHGIFGNALAFPQGARRDFFLAAASPRIATALRRKSSSLFAPANYGHDAAVLMTYNPSAAWAWGVRDELSSPFLCYTDV